MLVEFDWNIILDNAMTNLGVVTDFALAKAMNLTHAAVAQYRKGTHIPGPEACFRLAELNGANPLAYIAAAEAARARSPQARRRWLKRAAALGRKRPGRQRRQSSR